MSLLSPLRARDRLSLNRFGSELRVPASYPGSRACLRDSVDFAFENCTASSAVLR
jgi:hypothetical protein